jgi:hypothetical protein
VKSHISQFLLELELEFKFVPIISLFAPKHLNLDNIQLFIFLFVSAYYCSTLRLAFVCSDCIKMCFHVLNNSNLETSLETRVVQPKLLINICCIYVICRSDLITFVNVKADAVFIIHY